MRTRSNRSNGCISLTLVVEVRMREVGFACLGLKSAGRTRACKRTQVSARVLFARARVTSAMRGETKASMSK